MEIKKGLCLCVLDVVADRKTFSKKGKVYDYVIDICTNSLTITLAYTSNTLNNRFITETGLFTQHFISITENTIKS